MSDSVTTVYKSALYSFTASTIKAYGYSMYSQDSSHQFNLMSPMMNAGIAALDSLIYSLMTPIFRAIFEDHQMNIYREITRELVNVILSAVLINYLTVSKVNLSALTILKRSYSLNTVKAILDVIPNVAGWWRPGLRDEIRAIYHVWGLQMVPSSGSIFLNI